MSSSTAILIAFGIGIVAGLRAMTAPAVVACTHFSLRERSKSVGVMTPRMMSTSETASIASPGESASVISVPGPAALWMRCSSASSTAGIVSPGMIRMCIGGE